MDKLIVHIGETKYAESKPDPFFGNVGPFYHCYFRSFHHKFKYIQLVRGLI